MKLKKIACIFVLGFQALHGSNADDNRYTYYLDNIDDGSSIGKHPQKTDFDALDLRSDGDNDSVAIQQMMNGLTVEQQLEDALLDSEFVSQDYIDDLLAEVVNPNYQDKNGVSLLHVAAVIGNLDVIKVLYEKGAIIDVVDKNNNTALQDATNNNQAEVVQYLVEHGANPYIKNKYGVSAYDIAQRNKNADIIAIFEKQDFPTARY